MTLDSLLLGGTLALLLPGVPIQGRPVHVDSNNNSHNMKDAFTMDVAGGYDGSRFDMGERIGNVADGADDNPMKLWDLNPLPGSASQADYTDHFAYSVGSTHGAACVPCACHLVHCHAVLGVSGTR